MKFVIVLVALFAVALSDSEHAKLLKHEEIHEENRYSVEYHLDDGTVVKEHGVKVEGPEGDVWHKSGSYRYISPEGKDLEVTYTADENGFQPHGDHLPKEPVLPH